MATVDWSGWLQKSLEEQREVFRRYRDIVKYESDRARLSNYARMNEALGISAVHD